MVWVLVIVVVLVATVVIAVVLGALHGSGHRSRGFTVPFEQVAPRSAVPKTAPADTGHLVAWSKRVAAKTDIPPVAARAYAYAAGLAAKRTPGCAVNWTTAAAIGRIESKHGRHGGAGLRADGRTSRPIVGPALDGSPGVQRQPDTDDGRFDGDKQWDHAVGPMQFLPQTWQRWGVRASGDGRTPDPQNIDDAAATAARYVCLNGNRMDSPDGWWDGVFKYNKSVRYGQEVFSAAEAYAKAVRK